MLLQYYRIRIGVQKNGLLKNSILFSQKAS